MPDIEPVVRASPGATATSAVNRAFADAVLAELDRKPDADGLLPRLPPLPRAGLRARGAAGRAACTHFIHIPWAETDYWHVLPDEVRRAVHEGLLANDVVGFHTDRWRRNFVDACEAARGAESDSDRAPRPARRTRHARRHAPDLDRPRRVRRAEASTRRCSPRRSRSSRRGRSC